MIKKPENLYHYTSFENFTNIINSNELWMTDIRFLNDSSELNYAIESYKEYIEKINKNPRRIINKFKYYNSDFNKSTLDELLSILLNLIETVQNLHSYSFVFSLSEEGDLLSQWQGYTAFGKGISIGFNYERFCNEIHPDPSQKPNNLSRIGELLYPCLYSRKKLYKTVEATLLGIYANNFSEGLTSIDFIDVWSECLHIKHDAFKEEKEWRLSAKLNNLKNIDHLTGSHSIIPIFKNKFDDISNYIDHIVIGPNPNMNKAVRE